MNKINMWSYSRLNNLSWKQQLKNHKKTVALVLLGTTVLLLIVVFVHIATSVVDTFSDSSDSSPVPQFISAADKSSVDKIQNGKNSEATIARTVTSTSSKNINDIHSKTNESRSESKEDYYYEDYILDTTSTSTVPLTQESCENKHKQPCECRKLSDCQYDTTDGFCVKKIKSKIFYSLNFHQGECIRPRAFYLFRGIACRNFNPDTKPLVYNNENCDRSKSKTIIAVNLGGENFTDSEGIKYEAGKNVNFSDPFGIARHWTLDKVAGVNPNDKMLYQTHLWGNSQVNDIRQSNFSDVCVTFDIPLESAPDGNYELNIKTAETWHSKKNVRSFNVKLNDHYLLHELDILEYSGWKGFGIDFFANLRISENGTKLHSKGYPESNIKDGKIPLAFCLGECRGENRDPNFVVSAFSLLKFRNHI